MRSGCMTSDAWRSWGRGPRSSYYMGDGVEGHLITYVMGDGAEGHLITHVEGVKPSLGK